MRCALRMLDREGPEALSFRAVARELGMTVGALSRYFRNLADLEDEVAAEIMSELRPLEPGKDLREQLLRLGMDWLRINRAHPYLLKIHGAASAAAVARHIGQGIKVMVQGGIDFERALTIYSTVTNLAYAWGAQVAQQSSPAHQALMVQAFTEEVGELGPRMMKLSATDAESFHRRSFLMVIDGLLDHPSANSKKRG